MLSKYSTKQYISAQFCAKQMSEIWCKKFQAFLRYSNFRFGIFYFASSCVYLTSDCAVFAGYSVKDGGDIKFDEFLDDPTTDSNVRRPRSVGAANKKVMKHRY